MSSTDGKRPHISDDDDENDYYCYGSFHPKDSAGREDEERCLIKSLTEVMSGFSLSNSSGFNDDNVRENSSPKKQGDKQGWKKHFTSFLKSKGKRQDRDYANNEPWECTDDEEACPQDEEYNDPPQENIYNQPTYDENQVNPFQYYDGGLEGSSGAYSNYYYMTHYPSYNPVAHSEVYENPEHTQEHEPEGNTAAPTLKSNHRGVTRRGRKWVAEIRLPGTRHREWLGTFNTEEEAARNFDRAKIRIKGPRANPNMLDFPDNSYWVGDSLQYKTEQELD